MVSAQVWYNASDAKGPPPSKGWDPPSGAYIFRPNGEFGSGAPVHVRIVEGPLLTEVHQVPPGALTESLGMLAGLNSHSMCWTACSGWFAGTGQPGLQDTRPGQHPEHRILEMCFTLQAACRWCQVMVVCLQGGFVDIQAQVCFPRGLMCIRSDMAQCTLAAWLCAWAWCLLNVKSLRQAVKA